MSDQQLPIEGVNPEDEGEKTSRRRRTSRAVSTPVSDPLTAKQSKFLLTSSSVIRDPLHHDIRVTKFELSLIDSPAFQRLRRINQLAMVDLVYPGAVHTRFLHSIGTLHVCSELVRACNNSVKALRPLSPIGDPRPVRIGTYAELLARLVALLHDMAHVPFGHVFEREAQVFAKDEWEDPWRLHKTLGSDSEFAGTFRQGLAAQLARLPGEHAMSPSDAESAADRVLTEVRDTLSAKGAKVLQLRYPFVYDLVGNTICADLLDYVQRDMYFCGLTEGLAKRFLSYLAVMPVRYDYPPPESATRTLRPVREERESDQAEPLSVRDGTAVACRAVLLYYRYNNRMAATTKENVLAEAIDLVRTRKLVAEKLYFHKTKLIATSMLAAAAHASGIRSAERIWDKSDDEVLKLMYDEASGPEDASDSDLTRRRRRRARTLAGNLLARRLFKPVFRLSWHPDIEDPAGNRMWHSDTGVYTRYSTPAGREELIESIEEAIEENILRSPLAAAGAVSVSCPNRQMQLKAFEMLVLPNPSDPEIRPLENTVRPTVKAEIDVIRQQHRELWRLEVFVDPRVIDFSSEFAQRLAGAIQHDVGMTNELPEFRNAPVESLASLIRRGRVDSILESTRLTDRITNSHYSMLVAGEIAARGPDQIRSQLVEWGYLT